MDRLNVAEGVAVRLVAAERAIDAALQAQAELLAGLVHAQAAVRAAAPEADAAIARATAGVAALVAARGETVACHHALARLQSALGLPHVDVGQGDKDPPERPHRPRAVAA